MLTEDEARKLLLVMAAYDPRRADPSRVDLVVWAKASQVAKWPAYAEVEEAVHVHYATATYPIMPGHVTQILADAAAERRRASQLPPPVDRVALEAAREPSPEMSPARKRAWEEIVSTLSKKMSLPTT